MTIKSKTECDVQVICPDDNRPERAYGVKSLFSMLDISCQISYKSNCHNYILVLPQKRVIVEDHFFCKHIEPMSYLSKYNIPEETEKFNFGKNKGVPIIYGRDYYYCDANEAICGLDLFASAFFMLSRWEEHVIETKNAEGRCNERELLAVKQKFYKRPIAEEYGDILFDLLKIGGFSHSVPHKSPVIMLTHDVDRCYLSTYRELIKNLFAMLRRKQRRKAFLTLKRFLWYKLKGQNPFDSFGALMEHSEKFGFINFFFFKACEQGEYGYTYSLKTPFVLDTIKTIESRGHIVGFHPSENTIDSPEQFVREIDRLRAVTSTPVFGGRNHGLYYPKGMLLNWQDAELEYDSGCGFQYYNGFRAGACQPYPLFDIFSRQTLRLLEIPFLAMDSVWLRKKDSPEQFYSEVVEIADVALRRGGCICLNWHSNLIDAIEMKEFRYVYFKIVEYLGKKIKG